VAIATINPATGETVKTFDEMGEADVERCLATAAASYASYRLTSFADRAAWMRNAADILDAERDAVAAMMTTEMGKTLAAAKAEVAKCATACRYYAENAESFLAAEPAEASAVGAQQAYVTYQPLGPVLAIMPWNFPLWQAMRFAAPALMAGNVGLLKHASNVPQTALFMQDLFARAGFPIGSFQTLLVGSARVEAILRDRRVVVQPGRFGGGGRRRQRDQEGRARAGRQRPVRRHAVGRPAPGGRGRRDRAAAEQRPVLHRGQALHRPRGGLQRVRAPVHRADGGQGPRRPDG
jgi:delta 1-pyrroline-5-carboxylate dehydrogenase